MDTGIYFIENSVNGKMYVGSAISFKDRFSRHKTRLRAGSHHSIKLQHAWNKYGESAFVFKKLMFCAKEHLIFYEQRAIDVYDVARNGYNICATAGSAQGRTHSLESKAKMSASCKGRIATEETRAKMSAQRVGKKLSPEHRAKISAAGLGRQNTLGHKWTDEAKARLSNILRGRAKSEETKAKISAAGMGHRVSAASRAKMSASAMGNTSAKKRLTTEGGINGE